MHPWTLREGFAISTGLTVAGILLELSLGRIEWSVFAWPVNVVVLLAFLMWVVVVHLLRSRVYAFRFLATYRAAVPALAFAVVLTMVMGLMRQSEDGRWLHNMLSFWPFVLAYVYMVFILGLVTLKRLQQMTKCQPSVRRWMADLTFLLNHAGLFIALVAATLGSADVQRLRMVVSVDGPERRAYDEQHRVIELPWAIGLKRFIMETYADGSPKRYASEIEVLAPSGKTTLCTTEVNRPVKVGKWKIYQYSYDTTMGAMSRISILELVRDPWLPVVYTGIGMLLAGAVGIFFLSNKTKQIP